MLPSRVLPVPDNRFWFALCAASVAGADCGDFIAHVLHLGHWRGVPALALCFAGARLASGLAPVAAYWIAILLVRAAATNIADLMSHDLHAGDAVLLVVLAAGTLVLARSGPRRPADGRYWATMLLAGTLGTVIGDDTADRLGLGAGPGTVALGAAVLAVLAAGRAGRWRGAVAYWGAVVAIRSAGTTFGDYSCDANGLGLGLPLGTASALAVLGLLLLVWPPRMAGDAAAPLPARP